MIKEKRISIIGGPGTGKTTLANNLAKELNYPVCHIDGIHHLENWKIRDKAERDRIIMEKISEKEWIIDGTYRDTLEKRIEASDMVIFLDYSSIAKLKGILSRYLKNRGKEKPEIPGCREEMNLGFIKCTLTWNRSRKKFIYRIINYYREIDKKILIFKNRKKLNKWYYGEFKKRIECDDWR
jgi:adenylate kinase family enzyme